jgi:nicotinamidase/pyrazinamidase
MLPGGKLYVPGAEEVREEMGRLVAAAREAGVVHVASADDHELTDPEITSDPDFVNTFPPHCLRGTPGAHKIPETAQADPLPLPTTPYPPGLVPGLVDGRREILVLKKAFSPFANPNADALLTALDPAEIVVFGVATDVCDHQAIMGFLERGRRVAFVEDAARGLSEERVAACTALWRERGVRFTTTEHVVAALS